MNSSIMESAVSFEGIERPGSQPASEQGVEPVAMPYLGQSFPVGLVGAATVAAFVLVIDMLAGHPFATPNMLGAAILHGDAISINAPIQPGLVLGYTLLHLAAFVVVAAAAVSAEFTLSRAGIAPAVQMISGIAGLMLGLTVILGTLMTLVGIDWVGGFGVERVLSVNTVAAISMAITVHLRGEHRRLERAAVHHE